MARRGRDNKLLVMTTNLILLAFSFTIFSGSLLYYGILPSYSSAYYAKGKPALFTLALWLSIIPLSIVGDSALMFFAAAGICFVGAAPDYRIGNMELRVHLAGAYLGILFGLLAIAIDFNLWVVSVLAAIVISGMKLLKVRNNTYWIEILAYYLIFGVELVREIIKII